MRYVKAEFKDDATCESERMWVVVDSCDEDAGIFFGRLDNEPLPSTDLYVGNELAASYDKVGEHAKVSEFGKQSGRCIQPYVGHLLMESSVANRQDVVQLQRYP